jgi:hypothetical protein
MLNMMLVLVVDTVHNCFHIDLFLQLYYQDSIRIARLNMMVVLVEVLVEVLVVA